MSYANIGQLKAQYDGRLVDQLSNDGNGTVGVASVQQAALDAESQLKAAEANLKASRVRVENDLLAQTASAA